MRASVAVACAAAASSSHPDSAVAAFYVSGTSPERKNSGYPHTNSTYCLFFWDIPYRPPSGPFCRGAVIVGNSPWGAVDNNLCSSLEEQGRKNKDPQGGLCYASQRGTGV